MESIKGKTLVAKIDYKKWPLNLMKKEKESIAKKVDVCFSSAEKPMNKLNAS